MATLDLVVLLRAFSDTAVTSNPRRKFLDQTIEAQGIQIRTPLEVPLELAAGEQVTVFDGTRTIGADATTQLVLSVSPLAPDRYRLAWVATGTAPAFRVERAVNAATFSLTLTLNANLTVTVTGAGPTYSAAQVGDQVLIPCAATGDPAGPFSALNGGLWTVIGVTSTSLTLARLAGDASTGATETVTPAADQFIVMSPDRVQVGDQLAIAGGFSTNARRTYSVLAVAPKHVDVQSTVALAPETATLGASGLAVYAQAKRVVFVQADQLTGVYLNGDAAETAQIEPLALPSGERLGFLALTGPVWKMVLKNKASTQSAGFCFAAV